jgi:hypothetical protein
MLVSFVFRALASYNHLLKRLRALSEVEYKLQAVMICDLEVYTFIILESRHKSIAIGSMTINILTCFMITH